MISYLSKFKFRFKKKTASYNSQNSVIPKLGKQSVNHFFFAPRRHNLWNPQLVSQKEKHPKLSIKPTSGASKGQVNLGSKLPRTNQH